MDGVTRASDLPSDMLESLARKDVEWLLHCLAATTVFDVQSVAILLGIGQQAARDVLAARESAKAAAVVDSTVESVVGVSEALQSVFVESWAPEDAVCPPDLIDERGLDNVRL